MWSNQLPKKGVAQPDQTCEYVDELDGPQLWHAYGSYFCI